MRVSVLIIAAALVGTQAAASFSHEPSASEVLTGFSFHWDKRPHRFNLLEFSPWLARVLGGSWADGRRGTDEPNAHADSLTLFADAITTGQVSFAMHGRGGRHAKAASASAGIEILEPSGGLRPDERIVIALVGFELSTDENRDNGFTVNSLGARLRQPERGDDGVWRGEVETWVKGAAVPDRLKQSLKEYEVGARLDWIAFRVSEEMTSVATITGKFRAGKKAVASSLSLPRHEGWVPRAALAGFWFDGKDGFASGRYLRSLYVALGKATENEGRWSVPLSIRVSNRGTITRRFQGVSGIDAVVIQEPGTSLNNAQR